MLIPIIIAIENAKQNVMNLLYFSLGILKNMTRHPRMVDNPAKVEIINGGIILDIDFPPLL